VPPAGRGAAAALADLGLDPLGLVDLYHGDPEPEPDIVEWVVSDRYLDRPNLYPRQATLLKLIFLQTEVMTQYDWDVIGEWATSFARGEMQGVQPDIEDRIRICREQGRPWFREFVNVSGRRGSKGHTGALAGSYVIRRYMNLPGGAHQHYGIDRDKRLSAMVFAGKKEQAIAYQWADLVSVITGAPWFAPRIGTWLTQSLTLRAPTDQLRAMRQRMRGVQTVADTSSFEVVPRESTALAARGPAAFLQYYDEMAHILPVSGRSAEAVWTSATPAADQFGQDAFLYLGSSPWQEVGQFHEEWKQALEREDGAPVYPEKLMLQLPSWAIYEDWQMADQLGLRPSTRTVVVVPKLVLVGGGQVRVDAEEVVEEPAQTFQPLRGAIQTYDDQMRKLERANPQTFAVERRARWAAVLDAYLDKARIEAAFAPWRGHDRMAVRGRLDVRYKAHGDPAKVGDRFGFAIGHVEVERRPSWDPQREREVYQEVRHVVVDVVDAWEAGDWPDRQIHYVAMEDGDPNVEDDLWDYIERFNPEEMTFDQFASAGTVQGLQSRARRAGLPKATAVYEKPATAPLNWLRFECFKIALGMGLVHIPRLQASGTPSEVAEVLEAELKFLQRTGRKVDHPNVGPVQSKDVADCVVEVVWALIGEDMASVLGEDLMALGIQPTMRRGLASRDEVPDTEQAHEMLSAATRRTGPHLAGMAPAARSGTRDAPRRGWGRR
jgi:hypothetical protein